ncbi:TraB/GumN family protein [Chitinophaga dinghuensis]|nr:TraB/GumN family protein [Chitinophaga dinghuensis]
MPKHHIFLIKESACFFALDAAHLGGDDGLIRLLKARGYKVEPVFQ